MRLEVVGSSPAWPNPGEACSGHLVSMPRGSVLLDCGTGVLSRLFARGDRPDVIVLSHLHHDHCADLVPLIWAIRAGGLDWRPTVLVPSGGRVALDEMMAGQGQRLADMEIAMPVSEYRVDRPHDLAGGRLDAVRGLHSPYSRILRLTAGEASLVYTSDTPPDPGLVPFAAGAGLLLVEATVADNVTNGRGLHLTPSEAATLARDAQVGTCVLTHVPAALREAALTAARTIFPASYLALPDAVFEVNP